MNRWNQPFWLAAIIVAGGVLPVLFYSGGATPLGTSGTPQCALLSMHSMSVFEQWMAAITAFGIKPIYLLISLITIIYLWKQSSTDLVALRWGLIVFWLGENACSTNYLVYGGQSDLWEFLHNYGMAVAFSFVTFAVMEAIDLRILHYSAPKDRCGMLSVCRTCIKFTDAPCKARKLFAACLPALILVAVIPLCSKPHEVAYNVNLLGSVQTYSQPLSSQFFEIRYCPIVAISLLTASWLVLLLKRDDPVAPAKILFAAAMGPMGFGFMRLFLFSTFSGNLIWFDEWEEITELLFTMAVAYVLWTFRDTLFSKSPRQPSNPLESRS